MVIQLPDEKKARIETLAHERGFESAADYVLALIEIDAEQNILAESFDIVAEFREAWHDAIIGNTRPAREALTDIRRKIAS